MSEKPTDNQPGKQDSGENFVQHKIWQLEAERARARPDQHDDYDTLIQQWGRIVIDKPLSERAQQILCEQMSYTGGWIFGTPVELGEHQYSANIPMLPVHVSETEMEMFGGKSPTLLFSEEGVSTERGGIARSFAIPIEDDVPKRSVSRISITPHKPE